MIRFREPSGRALPSLILSIATTVSVLGCAPGLFSRLTSRLPFRDDPDVDDQHYGITPAERVDELQSLAERADELSSTEQQAVSEQLAARLETESDPILRRQLAMTLGTIAAPGAFSGLYAATDDPDSTVRIAACDAWRRTGSPEAVNVLAGLLAHDSDVDVRLAAARALGNFTAPGAVRALGQALADPDPALRYRALLSLEQSSGEDFGGDVHAWQQYVQNLPGGREDAVMAGQPLPERWKDEAPGFR